MSKAFEASTIGTPLAGRLQQWQQLHHKLQSLATSVYPSSLWGIGKSQTRCKQSGLTARCVWKMHALRLEAIASRLGAIALRVPSEIWTPHDQLREGRAVWALGPAESAP